MTNELSVFAARLRERMARLERHPRGVSISAATEVTEAGATNSLLSEEEFNSLALELFALQFARNAAYRRICEARGARPDGVEHWSRIPAVPAAAFKELELSCLTPAERAKVFYSSGTTEQRPSRHFHHGESLSLYEASLWSWFRWHVLAGSSASQERWQLAILTPGADAAPNSSLVHMFETIRRQFGADEAVFLGRVQADGAWTLEFARLEVLLSSAIAAKTPLLLLGTAFNFVHLLDWMTGRQAHFELPPGSVVMETGGYKGRSREMPKAELHRLMTERFGILPAQILCEYGMSELSSQAYNGIAGRVMPARHFHFPSWARARVISPESGREVPDGEVGLVRVYDLANTFSVLAVQTEDIALRRGNGFELMGRAVAAEPRGCSLMALDRT